MQSLKLKLLRLLEEDREFRLAVAGFLGYRDVLERLEEHDKKFAEMLAELREHRKLLEEHSRRFVSIERRLEEHDKKFAEMLAELMELRREFARLSMRVEVTIGSMGRRWGTDLERTVLELFREALERRGIEPGKVEKFRCRDEDGRLTGVRGRIVDVDVLVRDDKVYVIEVKSRAELDHVEALPEKARVVEKVLKRKVERTYLVAVNIDREAYERARELGIEVICGHVIG